MASTQQLVLILVSLLAVIPHSLQLNCTDACCYWYTTVVKSTGCSVDHHQVQIPGCVVLAPDNPLTNDSVRWYRSEDQETARVRGTSLLELNSTKYSLDYTRFPGAFGPNLFRHLYTLFITDFNTTDFGYYWCQLVVNDSCLTPSPYGHIFENPTANRSCSSTPLSLVVQPICAGSESSPDNVNCSKSETTMSPSMKTTAFNNTSIDRTTALVRTVSSTAVYYTTSTSTSDHNSDDNIFVIAGSVGGGVLLIFAVLLLCIGVCICLQKKREKRTKRSSSCTDVQLQNTPNEPIHVGNDNGVVTETSQQVSTDLEMRTVNATNEESHTYDSVDLDNTPSTTTPAPAPDLTTSHTYDATSGQQPATKPLETSQQAPSKPGFTSSVEYDEIDRDEAAQKSNHLYTEVRENTVGSKTINHAEKSGAPPSMINKVHQYDQVIRNQDTNSKTDTQPPVIAVVNPHHEPSGPMYHVLEDSSQDQQAPIFDDQYSAPQTHQLVLPTNTGAVGSPDERGLIIAVGDDKLGTATDTSQMAAENEHREPQYDQPFLNPGGPPNKDSSAKKLSSSNPLFDDPSYECGYPDPNTTSKTPGPQLSASTTSKSTSSGAVPEPPPRLESSQSAPRMNTYDDAVELMRSTSLLTKSSNTSRRQRDYVQTDLAKSRKRNTIGGSKLNGLFDDPSYEVGFARRAKKN